MSIERRIIPISSGKGGVGKTTIALNYALSLSRHGRTILVDLDTGTSSIRNCVDTKVTRDLYHFFKKGHNLGDCVTTLDARLDPVGTYSRFGFVAAPKHLIEDITNFTAARREQLIDALNGLDANFIVLDLKAGLDANVIGFLPYSNSGILVFTPQLPSATLAAADIVKAILFRKLRVLFAEGSPVYAELSGLTPAFVSGLLDRVEDVYDSGVHNLDAFVADLQHALGEHAVFKLIANAVDSFVVHYVLNRFDGVRTSYDSAIKPFLTSLAENVSSQLTILNLGWVVESGKLHDASVKRVPALLLPEAKRLARPDPAHAMLDRLAAEHLPKAAPRPEKPRAASAAAKKEEPRATRYLDTQLDTLRRMYDDLKSANYRENFAYLTARSLHVMSSRRTSDFGDTRLFKTSELQQALHERGR